MAATLLFWVCACTASSPAEEAPPHGGGAGGAGGGGGGCTDLGPTGGCRFQGFGNGCAEGDVCTVGPHPSCGAIGCCTLPVRCEPKEGTTLPGFRCEENADCSSGLCVFVGGVGSCLRACDGTAASCPSGLACALLSLDAARSVRHCTGSGPNGTFDGELTLCAADSDCPQDRYCGIRDGDGLFVGRAHGLCEPGPRPEGSGRACEAGQDLAIPTDGSDLHRGIRWSSACPETGLCHAACDTLDSEGCNCVPNADEPFCRGWRCLQPCSSDGECPSRHVCRAIRTDEQTSTDPDLNFRFCQFPGFRNSDWGCFDETDCCQGGLQRRGTVCCNQDTGGNCFAPPPDVTHCRVELLGTRFLSRCQEPAGLAGVGEPCADHAACESGLCDPAASCTSPCDPGDGDRCAELVPGSSCCTLLAGEACVPACRADCGAAGGCPP